MSKSNSLIREDLFEWINRTYLGPYKVTESGYPDLEEAIDFSPKDLYTTGILYPQVRELEDLFSEEVETVETETDLNLDEDNKKDSVNNGVKKGNRKIVDDEEEELKLTTEFNPSSLAISFLCEENQKIHLKIKYGKYFPVQNGDSSYKRSHFEVDINFRCTSEGVINESHKVEGWKKSESGTKLISLTSTDDTAKVKIISRNSYTQNGAASLKVITVSLINSRFCVRKEQKKVNHLLFQPEIKVNSTQGFQSFPDLTNLEKLTEEEKEIKFLYRGYKNFGQGHGCAVDWKKQDNKVVEICSAVLPNEKINGVDFNPEELDGIDNILYMKVLSKAQSKAEKEDLFEQLNQFILAYEKWIGIQEEEIQKEKLNLEYQESAKKILDKCRDLYSRMQTGIDLLRKDPTILKSFLDANKAMFYQRVMADFAQHRRLSNRILSNDNRFDDPLPEFDKIPFDAASNSIWENGKLNAKLSTDSKRKLAKWRPFQLAFILSQIQGATDIESEDRDTVDLLWFSTGGGKTEAYLGLIAFTIFYQRQTTSFQDSGVTVMMRYTLRMLNKQQFSRANILICSCELIRFNNPSLYGTTRISNGLWVGGTTTPNKHTGSDNYPGNNDYLQKYKERTEAKRFNEGNYSPPVFTCPCCGNKLVKEIHKNESGQISVVGRWGYHQIENVLNRRPFPNQNPFYLHCTNTKCHFHVGENEFKLRRNDNSSFMERTLPIYYVDEDIYSYRPTLLFSTVDKYAQLAWRKECFHLFNFNSEFKRMADPPSLIVQDELHLISSSLGTIYSLFEFVIDLLCTEKGIQPKIVGATATVRNARQQCIKIYNRKKYAQFPPSGIQIDDSFYSRKKTEDANARLYMGVMPAGFTSTTAKLRLDSILLEGTDQITNAANENADNYYTLLAYFNTVKELGKYRTLLEDDMVSYRRFLSLKLGKFFKQYDPDRIIELSSQMNSDQINRGLEVLEKIKLHSINEKDPIIQFLNSISIRSSKDLEDTRFKTGWSFSWLRIINEYWDHLKPLCGLQEDMRVNSLNSEDDRERARRLLDHCCNLFLEKINEVKGLNNEDPIKVALSTNMISVGVDIPRLNVMSISGQPKTTAEYIQASSRVGREVPGVVFTLYNPAKNRDRSHYENFKDYHQAYYKYVEATSVTPFSLPALEKTIDSVLISLMRGLYIKEDADATLYPDREEKVRELGELLFQRFCAIEENLENVDPEMIARREKAMNEIVEDVIKRWKSRSNLTFTSFWDVMKNPLAEDKLRWNLFTDPKYRDHHLTQDMLFAMSSLRDVDTSSNIKLKSYIE
ncbi:helicase-related protein [Salegentibacter salarius]|uniref:Helicase C-terminal domain-containing protein n=1 Tax=Salegentibacter salarius TaxID=435906 RepID=A0A2N0TRF3_9FLAO|nr:helicase-related protein [Salegentibacter salarius]OEY71968.1 hypothetical protein BHS39_14720 [Salegentibacter salarius]PKD17324.1 hypothetical protein APR40_14690 [Salegentibacter salarius]SLK05607.1 Helicase conserved C-terminal domain-containing protein [Salegentibacter salarius]